MVGAKNPMLLSIKPSFTKSIRIIILTLTCINIFIPLLCCKISRPPGMKLPQNTECLILRYSPSGRNTGFNNINISNISREGQYPPVIYIDNSANIYINHATFNAKYNDQGKELYRNIFAGNNLVWTYLITNDEKGNIFTVSSQRKNKNLVLTKYNGTGQEEWQIEYGYPCSTETSASVIGTDGRGNCYIAGVLPNGGTSRNFKNNYTFIAKFNYNGSLIWQNHCDSEQGIDDIYRIQIDKKGNIILLGRGSGSAHSETPGINNFDFILIKYDNDGNRQWVTRFDSKQHGYDEPKDLAIDVNNNILVTGVSEDKCTTVKYDENGREIWTSWFNSSENKGSSPSVIKTDNEGNVYITGRSTTLWGSSFLTIKYNDAGKQEWVNEYSHGVKGLNSASVLVIDDSNNVYVSGRGSVNNQSFFFDTIKYTSDGREQWVANYPVSSSFDIPINIFVDSNDNIILFGLVNRFS